MTAAEALQAWLQHLAHERRSSPRTIEAYGDAVRRYLDFLQQHRVGFKDQPPGLVLGDRARGGGLDPGALDQLQGGVGDPQTPVEEAV